MDIADLLTNQHAYFSTGATLPVDGRRQALRRLGGMIAQREGA